VQCAIDMATKTEDAIEAGTVLPQLMASARENARIWRRRAELLTRQSR
jgi:hypothetical protein